VCLDVFIVRLRVTGKKLGEENKKRKRQIKTLKRQVAFEISSPLGLLGLLVLGDAFP
jgi:hypothetical protein